MRLSSKSWEPAQVTPRLQGERHLLGRMPTAPVPLGGLGLSVGQPGALEGSEMSKARSHLSLGVHTRVQF